MSDVFKQVILGGLGALLMAGAASGQSIVIERRLGVAQNTTPDMAVGSLQLDCYGYGDLANTGTRDNITVTVYGGITTEEHTFSPTNDDCEPNFGDSLMTVGILDYIAVRIDVVAHVDYPISRIRVETDGSDAFWLDQMILSAYPSNDSWGVNEGRGYCFSTDPNDANGSWRSYVSSRGCQRCMDFYVDGSVENC